MRTFTLLREVDETGISGTGIVAQGVVFEDGTVAMRWLTETASTALYNDIVDLEAIHGHNGNTRIVWETTYRFRDGEETLPGNGVADAYELGRVAERDERAQLKRVFG